MAKVPNWSNMQPVNKNNIDIIGGLLNKDSFFKTLFESIPLGVMIVDSEHRIRAINNFMQQAFNVSTATLIDKELGEIIKCIPASNGVRSCERGNACTNCKILNPALIALGGHPVKQQKLEVQLRAGNQVSEKIIMITATPFEYLKQNYAILLLEDITELFYLRKHVDSLQNENKLIGTTPAMVELKKKIKILAQVDAPVMIQGESGTGKELVARSIHSQGPRAHKPFVTVNCSALPDNLLESELFGHIKGAFTGAIRDRKGRFELADGGIIFLDEVGDTSPAMQVKLLRVLQEGTFERVGSETTYKVNVRVISATHKNIKNEVNHARFRKDLYYRLCVLPLYIPPLRDRGMDIPLLINHILTTMPNKFGSAIPSISKSALEVICKYSWPGNVRELQNVVQYALVQSGGKMIQVEHLPLNLTTNSHSSSPKLRKARRSKLESPEKVFQALENAGGDKIKAAHLLGVSRATLYRFLQHREIPN